MSSFDNLRYPLFGLVLKGNHRESHFVQKKRATSFLRHVREAIGLLHKATSQAKSRRHEPEDSCLEFSFMYKEPLWSAVHITHIILHIAFAL